MFNNYFSPNIITYWESVSADTECCKTPLVTVIIGLTADKKQTDLDTPTLVGGCLIKVYSPSRALTMGVRSTVAGPV